MVKSIYFVKVPYSDFSEFKGRPILVFKELENDFLFLPLTSNLKREGILLINNDLESGSLKKESIVIVPKINAIDKNLI
ncbi:MAG: growth inhibitor PemK [Campylobacterota bacterium]|nr:growth inhibitor PemK [Campylobacterota bacterium]